jgi:hypothetical protein
MARSSSYEVNVTFTMTNGSELVCQYSYSVTHGNYSGLPENCYPDEYSDNSEPTYFLDGTELAVDKLPKGLAVIAAAMYDDGRNDSRFAYKEDESQDDSGYDDSGYDY